MAATAPHDDSTDLIIVGGGPAGCAAAVMAASVGMRSILIEADALCTKLQHIGALNNVVGGFTSGPELAAAIANDIARTQLCRAEVGIRATEVLATDDQVTVILSDGRRLTAPHAVVATGVGPLPTDKAPWLTVTGDTVLPTLWGATIADHERGPLLVLGADRPLGTFLRTHPTLEASILVAYPPADDYKIDEVRDDPRVTLLPVTNLLVSADDDLHFAARWRDREGRNGACRSEVAYLNLGSAPIPPAGAVIPDSTGHCPPELQHPRILTAGDLRSSHFQRIMAATGSGSEAALQVYYTAQAPSS